MTIVVTDHHEVPYTEIGGERRYILPEADAVVDPKQEDCTYPFKGLCGAAVAYKLVEALMEAMGKDAEDADYLMEMWQSQRSVMLWIWWTKTVFLLNRDWIC